jgi:hypothetical protein
VSTPQDVALKDAVRGVEMFRKVKVPVRHAAYLLPRTQLTFRSDPRHGPEHVCIHMSELFYHTFYLRP